MSENELKRLCGDIKTELDKLITDTIFKKFQERLYIDEGNCHFEHEIMLDIAEDEVAKWIAIILVSQMRGGFE